MLFFYLDFIFDIMFSLESYFLQITGLALIITGCVIQGVYSNYLDFLGDSFFNTPVLLGMFHLQVVQFLK